MMRIVHLKPFQRVHFASNIDANFTKKAAHEGNTLKNERGCPSSRLGVDMVSFWVFKKEKAIILSISLRVFRIEISI